MWELSDIRWKYDKLCIHIYCLPLFSELVYLLIFYSLIYSLQTPLTSTLTNGFWSTLTALQCGEYFVLPCTINSGLQWITSPGAKIHLHPMFAKFIVVTSLSDIPPHHNHLYSKNRIVPHTCLSCQHYMEKTSLERCRVHKAFSTVCAFVCLFHLDSCLWDTSGVLTVQSKTAR